MEVAQIGFGRWGQNIYKNLKSIDSITKIYIVDPAIKTFPNLKKLENIIENNEIEAVFISTPAITHFDLTKTMIENDKHVFCEKPLAFSEKEASEIKELIESKKKTFISGHTFLFNDAIDYLKDYINENKLVFSTIFGKYSSFGTNISDTDVLWDFGPHVVSIMNYILGTTPKDFSIHPMSFNKLGKLETCIINLQYEATEVSFELNWLSIKKKREIEFNNLEKLIRWCDVDVDRPIEIYDKIWEENIEPGVYSHFHNISHNIFTPALNLKEPLLNELMYFINSIEEGKYKNLKSGIEFTTDVILTLEKISDSFTN